MCNKNFGKKGVSHLESILAFVLFMGFLIFAFIFFSPFESGRTLDSSIDYTFREISDFAKIPVETYGIVLNGTMPPSSIVGIEINSSIQNKNISIVNSDGRIVQSFLQNNVSYFSKQNAIFVKIKFAEGLPLGRIRKDQISKSPILTENENYSISSTDFDELFSETKFIELNESYYANYTGLKKQFNIPNKVDFGFSVEFDDEIKITAERIIPENLEVISQNDRIEVIRLGGDFEFADLTIKVW